MKTWKFELKAAGTQVRGGVTIAADYRDSIHSTAYDLGETLVKRMKAAASAHRPADESQILEGPEVEHLAEAADSARRNAQLLRSSPSVEQAAAVTKALTDICRPAMEQEPRFTFAYYLARSLQDHVNNLHFYQVEEFCDALEDALPQTSPQPAQPLFALAQPGPEVLAQFTAGDFEVTVHLQAKRPVYGVLRTMLRAAEECVDEVAGPSAREFYQALAHATTLLKLAQSEAYGNNELLRQEVQRNLEHAARILAAAREEFAYFAHLVARGELKPAAQWLPTDIRSMASPRLQKEESQLLIDALTAAIPGRTVAVFYEPESGNGGAFPGDWAASISDFKPLEVVELTEDLLASETTQVFRARY